MPHRISLGRLLPLAANSARCRRLKLASLLCLSTACLTACAGQTPPPPLQRIVTVYPDLPSTSCPPPADLPATVSSPRNLAAFLNGDAGRALLAGNFAGHWDCYDKLRAVDKARAAWPQGAH